MVAAVTAAFLTPAVLDNQTATAGNIFSGMRRTHQVTPHDHPATKGGVHPLQYVPPGLPTARITRVYLKRAELRELVAIYKRLPEADKELAELKKEKAGLENRNNQRRDTTTQQEIAQSPQEPDEYSKEISRTQRNINQLDRELNRLLGTRWDRWFEKLRDWIYQKLWRSPFKKAVSYPSTDEALQKFDGGTSNWALISGKDKTDSQWKWFTVLKFDEKIWVLPAQGDDRGSYFLVDSNTPLPELTNVKLTSYESLPWNFNDWKTLIINAKKFREKLNP